MENIPLATPFCIAIISAPRAPPAAALRPNALAKISLIAQPILSALAIRIATQIITYAIAMKGTTIVVTLAILWIPPITTRAVRTATTIAVRTIAHE